MTSQLHILEGQARLQRLEESITAFLTLEPSSTSTCRRGEVDTTATQSRQVWETGLLAIHELHHDELFRFAPPPENQSVATYFHARFGLAQGDLSDMLDCAQVLIDLRSPPQALEPHTLCRDSEPLLQTSPPLPPPPSMDVALAIGAAVHSRHARQQLWAEIVSSSHSMDAANSSTATAAAASPLPPLPVPISALTPFHVQLFASTLFPPSGASTPGGVFLPNRGCPTPASVSACTSPILSAMHDVDVGQAPCAPVVSRARRCEPCPRANGLLSLLSAPVPNIELPSPATLPHYTPALEAQVQEECNRSDSESVPPAQ